MKIILILLMLCGWVLSVGNFSNITVNVTLSQNYTTTEFQTYFESFSTDWGGYIMAILTLGISFILSDRYSQVFLLSGIGWTLIGFFTGMPVFFIGGVIMFIAGSIMKFVIG